MVTATKAQKLSIDQEISDLLPRLSEEISLRLETSLLTEGCRVPLDVWRHGGKLILLDGHNRHAICKAHDIAYAVREMEFASRNAALQWVIDQQLAKRNLTPEQYAYYRGKRYLAEKEDHGGDRKSEEKANTVGKKSSAQNAHLKTAEKIATETGVNPATVRRDAEYAEAIDGIGEVSSDARQAILAGDVKSTRKDTEALAELPPAKRRKAAKAIADGKADSVKEAVAAVTKEEDKGEAWEDDESTDYVGKPLPKRVQPAFANVKRLRKLCASINAAVRELEAVCQLPGGEYVHEQSARASLRNAKEAVFRSFPHAVCPSCRGKGCEPCRETGWLTKLAYDQTPKEKR